LPVEGEVYAKAENFQRTGSFKYRGAYNFLASLTPEERNQGVVAHSSGNHAQAVALAAKSFGVSATLVIPEGAPEIKVRRTIEHGAKVLRCNNNRADRTRVAAKVVKATGKILIPPFEHLWIVAGQGTAGLEIVEDLPEVNNVMVCVGGGGLLAGVATAVKSMRPQAQVIAVEPELAADAAESFEKGAPIEWLAEDVTRTIADGVRTQQVGNLNFSIIRDHVDGFITVSEEDILKATQWYALEARLIVEPTGALTLAGYRTLLTDTQTKLTLNPGPTVLLVSGGNIDPVLLAELIRGNLLR
jgi:threonine dehydratase